MTVSVRSTECPPYQQFLRILQHTVINCHTPMPQSIAVEVETACVIAQRYLEHAP